jgi:NTE family protein
MRVGLVLGAGGVVGASWLIGALEALESETGFAATGSDVIVGTSAGSVVGALTAAGWSAPYMSAYASGRSLDGFSDLEGAAAELDALALQERESADRFRLQLALPPIGPGSWRMALSTLRNPFKHAPAAVIGGWLPRGTISTVPIRSLVDRFVGDAWPERLRVVACDYRTGRRVCFGSDTAPPAEVADAVAASCAIPAFYHPVKVGSSRYVDGGVCSPSNLDLARGHDLDLVICLNPTSSLDSVPIRTPGDAMGALMRRESGKRLGHEARKVRESGTEVVLLQPTRRDLEAMGPNLMSRARRVTVGETAVRTTALELRRLRGSDVTLPGRKRRAARKVAAVKRAA